jgi:hypothetical protein
MFSYPLVKIKGKSEICKKEERKVFQRLFLQKNRNEWIGLEKLKKITGDTIAPGDRKC